MLNIQITAGRLTATPELRYSKSNKPVCSFTVASDDDRKNEDGTRNTDFVDCVAWNGQAEFITKYLTKGRFVIVVGRPKTRTYKDKNDVTHKVTELVVDKIYLHSCCLQRCNFNNQRMVGLVDYKVHTRETYHFVQLVTSFVYKAPFRGENPYLAATLLCVLRQ